MNQSCLCGRLATISEMPTVYDKETGTALNVLFVVGCDDCECFTQPHSTEGAAWREWNEETCGEGNAPEWDEDESL